MNEPTRQRYAPIALWRVASRLLVTLFNLFGEPQDLAFKHTVVARDYKLICNWLRSVEALFRKLLLIEASYYAHEAAQTSRRANAKRQRREMTFYPEQPEAWRVTFRTSWRACNRTRGAIGRQEAIGTPAPTTFHSAWPLAERFEALLRVHNDPAPYAKRLARQLYATPHCIASIIEEPPELQYRIDPEPHAEIADIISARSPIFARAPNTS